MIAEELQGKILKQELLEFPEYNANVKIGEDVFTIYVPEEREPNLSVSTVDEIIKLNYTKYGMSKNLIDEHISKRRNWIRGGCLPAESSDSK